MMTNCIKFLVNIEDKEIILEFKASHAGGGEHFYFLDNDLYRYDSIKKEIYTLSYGNKTVHYTDVKPIR